VLDDASLACTSACIDVVAEPLDGFSCLCTGAGASVAPEIEGFSFLGDLLDDFSLLGDVVGCFSFAAALDDLAIPDISCDPTSVTFPQHLTDLLSLISHLAAMQPGLRVLLSLVTLLAAVQLRLRVYLLVLTSLAVFQLHLTFSSSSSSFLVLFVTKSHLGLTIPLVLVRWLTALQLRLMNLLLPVARLTELQLCWGHRCVNLGNNLQSTLPLWNELRGPRHLQVASSHR
jgi:hypothetical protein